jgi:hypothetical protein
VSLLDQIQSDAINPDVDVTVLLRKCKVLAARLGSRALEKWVDSELGGYAADPPLPPYRIGPALALRGNFMNSAYQATGISVPLGALPEDLRGDLAKPMEFREGIAALQQTAAEAGGRTVSYSLPPALVGHVRLYERMPCYALWGELSGNFLTNLVDQVRNRALSLALEIEKEDPEAGEGKAGSTPIPEDRVNHIYSTTIFGSVGAFAAGQQSIAQANVDVHPGDLDSLIAALRSVGVSKDDLDSLVEALREDEGSRGEDEIGERTSGWLARIALKLATGAANLTVSAGAEVLGLAIAKYLNIT